MCVCHQSGSRASVKSLLSQKEKEMKRRIIGRRRKRSYEVALQTKIWFWWFDDTVYYFRHPDQEYEVIADKILDLSNEHNAPIARVERIMTKTGKHGQNKSKALPG